MSGCMIITGGTRGIGAAVARLAAARGYSLCLNYRSDESSARALADEIGDGCIAVRADVTRAGEVRALFDRARDELGPPAALVNNAGITGRASRLDEADPSVIAEVIDVNVLGMMLCAREAVRRMSTLHGGSGGGIVNISSGAVSIGSAGEYVWYAASKAAVDTFTLGLGIEVATEGIRVNAVAPGIIDTDIHAAAGTPDKPRDAASRIPLKRVGTPQEVARAVLWLLSDEASYVQGAVLRVGGGR